MASETFGLKVDDDRIDINKATGRAISHIAESKSGDCLLIGFIGGGFAFLEANYSDAIEEVSLTDECFTDWHAQSFEEEDLVAIFGQELVTAFERNNEQKVAENKALTEAAERKHYEFLKAKFEQTEQ